MNIVDQPDEAFTGDPDSTDENMLHDSEHGQISHDTKPGTIEIDQNWDSTDALFNELAVERATNSPDTSTSNMPDDEPSSNTTPADGTTLCDMTPHEHLTVGHDSKDIAKPMNGAAMPQDQLLNAANTCGSSKNIDLEGNSDGEVLFNELAVEQSEHIESPVPRGEELRDANRNDADISTACTVIETDGSNDMPATGGEVEDTSLNDTQLTNGYMSEMGQDTGGEELRDANKNDTEISTDSAGYDEPDGSNDVSDAGGDVEDSV